MSAARAPSAALRLLAIGAHPDDCEVRVGGMAALFRQRGWSVTFASLTNGDAGHQALSREALAARRRAEARAVGERFGIDYVVLDNHDGELEATLENRKRLIRLIRECRPDLVVSHRPYDYHPDHRYTAILVQDAAFLVTVPRICEEAPPLPRNPVFAYFQDAFTRPVPFTPSLAVDITGVMDRKMEMLHAHASQFYEWLPFLSGELSRVPAGEAERRRFLFERWAHRSSPDSCRALLIRVYGEERARTIRHAESLEINEYGSPLDETTRRLLLEL